MNSKSYGTLLLSVLIFLIGCSSSIKKKSSSSKSEAEHKLELTSYLGEKITFKDYPCQEATEQAEKDFIAGNLYYFDLSHFDYYRSNKEMSIILKLYNIELFESLSYCVDPEESNCYEKYMNQSIADKHGSHFIDSLRNVAEIKYVENNPNKVYAFEECDTTSYRYSSATSHKDFFDRYKNDFFKNFNYPETYHFKDEKYYSYTSAKFTLNKDSSIKITTIETTFQNPRNEIHRNLFDERVKDFIKESNWIPAKSAGITVNSLVSLTFHYK